MKHYETREERSSVKTLLEEPFSLGEYLVGSLEISESNRLKNMMLDTWDGQIWYPRFYDMDTICSYNNSGEIKFDVDIEMEQGYWNTSSSRLWTRVRDLFHNELIEVYKDMRGNGVSYEGIMRYMYDEQIAKIPQTYYNKDFDIKYAPYADTYIGKAHGDGYEHMKRWLKNRFIFCDTLFDYAPSYNNDVLTIRANTTDLMSITIETYTPLYQHVSYYNGQMSKEKVVPGQPITFEGYAQTATDQEVLIYGGSNIKKITGISSMNPNSMLIGGATRLTELDISNCPILTIVNSNKANFSPHTYLNKLNMSNCPQLGGNLNVSNSPLLQEIDARGSAITGLLLPTSLRNLEALRLPNTIQDLTLHDVPLLHTIELDEGNALNSLSLSNCSNLTNCINFDLTKVPSISLDNSFDAEELYMSATTNLTLRNMPSLKRVIFTPNSEYSAFDINSVLNGANYKITTFNNPMMTDFITTAPHRLSYKNGEYGDITPNTAFTANTLDLADTQFQNVKFLCTTDIYNLKVPTSMKNFYCDSAFDIDTDVIEDASYEVIHEELIEPYTTNYEGEVVRYKTISEQHSYSTTIDQWPNRDLVNNGRVNVGDDGWLKYNRATDFLPTTPGDKYKIYSTVNTCAVGMIFYDSNYVVVSFIGDTQDQISGAEGEVPAGVSYVKFWSEDMGYEWSSQITTIEKYVAYTPNLIPSSANGSLIFNMYSNNTTQPTSTSPYMWDLTGLKLEDFYTYGMNNWVKPSDDSYININNAQLYKINNYRYSHSTFGELSGGYTNGFSISPILLDDDVTSMTVTTSNGCDMLHYYSTDWNGIVATTQGSSGGGTASGAVPAGMNANNTRIRLLTFASKNVEWFDIKLIGNTTRTIRYYTADMIEVEATNEIRKTINGMTYGLQLSEIQSITMPQRMPGYSVRLVNADITPNEYPTMLYPKLIDTGLPITGKLDYTKYNGTSLAWAYAYTTDDVNINPLGSQQQGQITQDYNKLYGTDFVDIIDVWIYKDIDVSKLSVNENITKAYIELTSANYTTRIDEVLQWYPNCTDLYLFEDGSVTSLNGMLYSNNTNYKSQITNVTFLDGYFDNLTNMENTFKNCSSLTTVPTIPSSVTVMANTFFGCTSLTTAPAIPQGVTSMLRCFQECTSLTQAPVIPQGVTSLNYTFFNCKALTQAPIIPQGVTNMADCFYGCSSLTQAPAIPQGVTNMTNTFRDCKALTQAPVIPNSVTSLSYTFRDCKGLTTIDTTNWDTSNVTTLDGVFYGCSNLTEIKGIENWNTSKVTGVWDLFFGCGSIEYIDLSKWDMSKMSSTGCMYRNCGSLKVAYLPIQGGVPNNALQGCSSDIDIIWVGERKTDLNLGTYSHTNGFRQEDIQELVPEHLADLHKDEIKISFSKKEITINNTKTTLE